MGLPGLRTHRKFRRLVDLLRIPEAHAMGHLQMLWETSWDHLSDKIGDETDVELSAGWVGEPGALCSALVSCGGKGSGFVDIDEDGVYRIHDFLEHAPRWVREKVKKRADLALENKTVSDVKAEAGRRGAAARWKDKPKANGSALPSKIANTGMAEAATIAEVLPLAERAENPPESIANGDGLPLVSGICHRKDGEKCPSPPLPSLKDKEPNGSCGSAMAPLEEFIQVWNTRLVPIGYARCDKATPKREKSLKARLKGDPDFKATFDKAVGFLSVDSWWRERAGKFSIDLLIEQVDRAQQLSEKIPTPTKPQTQAPPHRAAVDAQFAEQLKSQQPTKPQEGSLDLTF